MADYGDMPTGNLMAGKRGIIMGVANKNSIAWGIAQQLAAQGAEICFTYQGETLERRVRPLVESIGMDFMIPADVTDDASMDAAFAAVKDKCLDFSCEASGERVLAMVDHSRTSQVLSRLIDNAVKFTPEGGRVHVSITQHDHDFVELSVADSGPGVNPENREAVFDKFQQLSDHMVDKPEGTGLGLAICRRSVDLQGGTLWCDDSPLGGAMFRMLLPAVTPESQWPRSTMSERQTT